MDSHEEREPYESRPPYDQSEAGTQGSHYAPQSPQRPSSPYMPQSPWQTSGPYTQQSPRQTSSPYTQQSPQYEGGSYGAAEQPTAQHYLPPTRVQQSYMPAPSAYTGSHSEQELGAPPASAANYAEIPHVSPDDLEQAARKNRKGGCKRFIMGFFEWLFIISLAIGASFLIRSYIAEVYVIPTGSMLETIQLGDRVVGEKISYRLRAPEVGEVITFNDPDGSGAILIKRVIAVGGQTIDLIDGKVVVDGQVIDEPYVLGKPTDPLFEYSPVLSEEIGYPYTVPTGSVWVMGDNRTNSKDSRYFGPIALSEVSSRALFVFWPFEDFRSF